MNKNLIEKSKHKKRSRKNKNCRSKGKSQVLGNIGSGHHQISRNEKKKKKRFKKSIAGEQENVSKPNTIAGILSKR